MATITSTPTAGSLTVNGNTRVNGTISWNKPSVPSNANISSCKLTGTVNVTMSNRQVTVTINGTTVVSSKGTGKYTFEIDLGTSNNTTSVATTAKGSQNKASGTVSFSNLVYTVTYTVTTYYTVTFKDWDGTVLKTESVLEGGSVTPPNNPSREGYRFTGWNKGFSNITTDLTIEAQYVEVCLITFISSITGEVSYECYVDRGEHFPIYEGDIPEGYKYNGISEDSIYVTGDTTVYVYFIKLCTVIFKDWDGTILSTQVIDEYTNATPPNNPSREGYEFIGWDKDFSNITTDLTIIAQYQIIGNNVNNIYYGDIISGNLYLGDEGVIRIYIGDTLIYEIPK